MAVAAVAVAIALTGCGADAAPTSLSGDEFAAGRGCGDTSLYAVATEPTGRELVLDVWLPALLARGDGAHELSVAGEGASGDETGGATARLTLGRHQADLRCNDAVEHEPVEEAAWTAVAGTVRATVRLDPRADAGDDGPTGRVDVTVTGLVLEGDQGTVTVDEVRFVDVAVGWLPG